MGTITNFLKDVREGRAGAPDQLFDHIYDVLKMIARSHLKKHRAGALQATDLVNAAYERLAAKEMIGAEDRRQFFFLLSRAMHDVLVEQVRSDLARKRGGGAKRMPLIEIAIEDHARQVQVLDLHEALADLGAADPVAARVVMLRFYASMSLEEAATTIGSTFAVTRRHWEYAKAWLHERLTRKDSMRTI
ncbi:MAG TPA: ECF-type sigma factor [Phycisphaerae bacterium]|nr:ECF-type sigma factor [Phycisphaerae bacterium]